VASKLFQHSRRYPTFLRHVVEKTLKNEGDELKERTLGVMVFKRAPEYDTSADPVVRNTASEVRKRLEDYYSQPEHASELRISLPVGAYVPEFRLAALEPVSDAPAGQTAAPSAPVRPKSRRGLWMMTAAGLALLAVAGAGIRLAAPKPAIDRFWKPIVPSDGPVLVVTETLMAIPPSTAQTTPGEVAEAIDPKVFLRIQEFAAKLASFLRVYGATPEIELARNVTLPRLRRGPFILLGAFNNPWTRRSVASFRFYLEFDRERMIRRIMDRQNPGRLDWAAPMAPAVAEDYALIVRAQDPDSGQMMLAVAGLGERGSAAAMEFVTNPKFLDRFASQVPVGWERRNVELVIHTRLVNEDWGEPQLVASHVW
jgi:hypothetical protein